MTCATPSTSRPLAATSVAISTPDLPDLKLARATSRCPCVRSPWISSTPTLRLPRPSPRPPFSSCLRYHEAICLRAVKTIVGPSTAAMASCSISSLCHLSLVASTMRCSMPPTVLPILPTVTRASASPRV